MKGLKVVQNIQMFKRVNIVQIVQMFKRYILLTSLRLHFVKRTHDKGFRVMVKWFKAGLKRISFLCYFGSPCARRSMIGSRAIGGSGPKGGE